METILFDPERMSKYYNCSGRTYEEWKALGQPNVLIGFVYALLGVLYLILLLPFMVVFVKSDLMRFSCYKIMFYLGLVDCIAIPIGGFYCGYAAAIGMVYCMAPTINYVFGGLALSCWCSGSTTCMILAVNRCIDIMNPRIGSLLFNKSRTTLWLIIPTLYFIYFFVFHTTVSFSSMFYAFFFDPFVGTPERHGLVDFENYPHYIHSTHNVIVAIVMILSYTSLLIHVSIKAAQSENKLQISRLQRQTFVQSTLVCSGTLVATFVYIYMQFLPTPVWVVVMGQLAWQTSHGAAGVSYAFLNPTMRKELLKIVCNSRRILPDQTTTGRSKVKIVSTVGDSGSDLVF